MLLVGFEHIISAEVFSVVERDALAQIKDPCLRVGARFPAFGQFADQFATGRNLGQAIVNAPDEAACMKMSDWVRPSQLSDVLAPDKPSRSVPPRFGAATAGKPVAASTPAAAPLFNSPRLFNVVMSFSLLDILRRLRRSDFRRTRGPDSFYILSTAASPMLSTPRSLRRFVSQSGSISGTELSKRSV